MTRRPNIVLILTDQERAAPPYEHDALRAWRNEALPTRRWLRDHGVGFDAHYAPSTACTPSRASIFSGQYPVVHGVTQTSGIAKHRGDARLRWFDPNRIPTLGHWMRAAGYDCVYKGKWHVSDADIVDDSGHAPYIADANGNAVNDLMAQYQRENRLAPFGFDGWIGPEPHGAADANSGKVRDRLMVDDTIAWLQSRAADTENERPFLLVTCFVNPHDICLWPVRFADVAAYDRHMTIPPIGPSPTDDEDLTTAPRVLAGYRDVYRQMYGPRWAIDLLYDRHLEDYRRFYYHLLHEVDVQMGRLLAALQAAPGWDDTIVITSSDHGDLLGAHGGLHQKWFNFYEESVRVPFTISHSGTFGPVGGDAGRLISSHVDILPTLLGLAQTAPEDVREAIVGDFDAVPDPVGRDLSGFVRGETAVPERNAVYFATEDRVVEGDVSSNLLSERFPPLRYVVATTFDPVRDGAASVEGVVATLDEAANPAPDGRRWKLARFHDDPLLWSHPGEFHEYRVLTGPRAGDVVRRDTPLPEEFQLFDLDADPAEMRNLISDARHRNVRDTLLRLLDELRAEATPQAPAPLPYATLELADAPGRLSPPDITPPAPVREVVNALLSLATGGLPDPRNLLP